MLALSHLLHPSSTVITKNSLPHRLPLTNDTTTCFLCVLSVLYFTGNIISWCFFLLHQTQSSEHASTYICAYFCLRAFVGRCPSLPLSTDLRIVLCHHRRGCLRRRAVRLRGNQREYFRPVS